MKVLIGRLAGGGESLFSSSVVRRESVDEEARPELPAGCYDLHGTVARPALPLWAKVDDTSCDGEDEDTVQGTSVAPGWIEHEGERPALGLDLGAGTAGKAASGVSRQRPRVVSAEGLVEAWMRSRLEDTSPACVASSARPSKGPVYPCQHFDDSDNEVEDAVPSGNGSGGSGFLMRTGQSDSYGLRDAERLALQRRPSLKLSIFPWLFRGGMSRGSLSCIAGSPMLREGLQSHDEFWFGKHLLRLQQDGMACSKVALNGELVQRSVHIVADSKSSSIELRGGKGGPKAVCIDDIVDIRQGFGSKEFRFFIQRFKKDQPDHLADRAVVLLSPYRSFSLILPTQELRDTLAHCILYLLEPSMRDVRGAEA